MYDPLMSASRQVIGIHHCRWSAYLLAHLFMWGTPGIGKSALSRIALYRSLSLGETVLWCLGNEGHVLRPVRKHVEVAS